MSNETRTADQIRAEIKRLEQELVVLAAVGAIAGLAANPGSTAAQNSPDSKWHL